MDVIHDIVERLPEWTAAMLKSQLFVRKINDGYPHSLIELMNLIIDTNFQWYRHAKQMS